MKNNMRSMPKTVLGESVKYCAGNLKMVAFLIAIALLFINLPELYFIFFKGYPGSMDKVIVMTMMDFLPGMFIFGYGLQVTKDVIDGGKKLPDLNLKKTVIYGVQAWVVITAALYIMDWALIGLGYLLAIDSDFALYFFDYLTANPVLFINDIKAIAPLNGIAFIILGIITTYLIIFFIEISLALLADTNRFLTSINVKTIKRTIDGIGWVHYTLDYTFIVASIAILSNLTTILGGLGEIQAICVEAIVEVLCFIIEFRMIGLTYRTGKLKRKSIDE